MHQCDMGSCLEVKTASDAGTNLNPFEKLGLVLLDFMHAC